MLGVITATDTIVEPITGDIGLGIGVPLERNTTCGLGLRSETEKEGEASYDGGDGGMHYNNRLLLRYL